MCDPAVGIGDKHPEGNSEVFVLEVGKLADLGRMGGVHRNVELLPSIYTGKGAAEGTVEVPGVAIEASALT